MSPRGRRGTDSLALSVHVHHPYSETRKSDSPVPSHCPVHKGETSCSWDLLRSSVGYPFGSGTVLSESFSFESSSPGRGSGVRRSPPGGVPLTPPPEKSNNLTFVLVYRRGSWTLRILSFVDPLHRSVQDHTRQTLPYLNLNLECGLFPLPPPSSKGILHVSRRRPRRSV